MTQIAINSDILALSIIFIALLAMHLYFKIANLRKVNKALWLQVDNGRMEREALEIKLQQLKWQNQILKEVK